MTYVSWFSDFDMHLENYLIDVHFFNQIATKMVTGPKVHAQLS